MQVSQVDTIKSIVKVEMKRVNNLELKLITMRKELGYNWASSFLCTWISLFGSLRCCVVCWLGFCLWNCN